MIAPQPGDYGCVSIPWLKKHIFSFTIPVPNVIGYLIRLGTWSRYDHSFVYVGSGKIVEAQPQGAVLSDLSKYAGDAIIWSADNIPPAQRKKIVNWALTLRRTPYGYLDILYLGLATLGLKFNWILRRVERQDRLICSQLVAVCGENAKVDAWLCGKKNACLVTPANLATHSSQELMNITARYKK